MKTITKKELIEKMNTVKGATILSVDVLTAPRMRKTDNPYMGATKVVTLSGITNFDYQNSVNNQLVREGKEPEFVSQKRTWGERQENWIVHNGNYYLQLKVQGSSTPVYRFNDEVIEKDVLQPFLQEPHKPHTQDTLEAEVVVRDIKLENIRCIRAFGEEYLVV